MTQWNPTRRTAIATIAAAGAFPTAAVAADTRHFVAGTYAREGGAGLCRFGFAPDADRWQLEAPVAGIVDASFGVGGGPGGAYYLLRERGEGLVTAYGADWRARGERATGGADPCHLAIDARSNCLAVAHYSSGSVAFHQLDPTTGVPGEPTLFRHSGSGPNRDRQAAPHAHWVGFSPDRRWLHSVDLGADAIFAYRFDAAERGLEEPVIAWRAPAGSGPRHLIRHPRLAMGYVACELGNTLVALAATPDGRFATRTIVSTLPAGFAGKSQAAHIAIDRAGRRLYVSNRGHDSIAVFALDAAGTPTLLQHVGTGGSWPRFFLLLEDQRRVIVANERAGTVVVFAIAADGRLAPTGTSLAVPGVVFLGAV